MCQKKEMKVHKTPSLSVEEYLRQEIETDTKYEYHDGKIYSLAGGTLNHGIISRNICFEIGTELEKKKANCLPFNSDVKLHIERINSYVYPDCMVICGEIEKAPSNKNAVVNPVLIIEVLSESTASYDRGDKFYFYRQIPSFKEYVLIEQSKHVVDVHFKGEGSDFWKITRFEGLDKIVELESIGVEISMERLYQRTEIEFV